MKNLKVKMVPELYEALKRTANFCINEGEGKVTLIKGDEYGCALAKAFLEGLGHVVEFEFNGNPGWEVRMKQEVLDICCNSPEQVFLVSGV